jgi:hypothetical protein
VEELRSSDPTVLTFDWDRKKENPVWQPTIQQPHPLFRGNTRTNNVVALLWPFPITISDNYSFQENILKTACNEWLSKKWADDDDSPEKRLWQWKHISHETHMMDPYRGVNRRIPFDILSEVRDPKCLMAKYVESKERCKDWEYCTYCLSRIVGQYLHLYNSQFDASFEEFYNAVQMLFLYRLHLNYENCVYSMVDIQPKKKREMTNVVFPSWEDIDKMK